MNTSAAITPRVLVGLTAAVLAAHFWLLRGAPHRVQAREAARPVSFATRSIQAPPVPAIPAVSPLPPPPSRAGQAGPQRGAVRVVAATRAPAEPPRPAVSAAAAGTAPGRVAVPGSMQVHYEVSAQTRGQAWLGHSELVWHRDGDEYDATMATANGGQAPRIQHSTGRITAQGLTPSRFSEKGRTEQAVHFESESRRVSFSNNRPAAALLAGAQDRLSVLLQLSAMLAGEPARYPPGTRISVQTATIRDADAWDFTVGEQEPLHLPGGTVNALKLQRPPRHEYDHRVELWLAPGQDYVPVRLRLTQPNGDWVDQQWSSTDKR